MELLRSKLYEWERRKQEEAKSAAQSAKSEISFGSQIRTYTLHPFKLVKDHRTLQQTSSAQAVLDGDLLEFSKSYVASLKKAPQ